LIVSVTDVEALTTTAIEAKGARMPYEEDEDPDYLPIEIRLWAAEHAAGWRLARPL
jgi:hypothetical protein